MSNGIGAGQTAIARLFELEERLKEAELVIESGKKLSKTLDAIEQLRYFKVWENFDNMVFSYEGRCRK